MVGAESGGVSRRETERGIGDGEGVGVPDYRG